MRVTSNTLQQTIDSLHKNNLLSLDCETSGLEESDRPFSFSVATATEEYNFDTRVIPDLFELPQVREFVASGHHWIMQNPKFDMRMMESVGCPIGGTPVDLTVAARLVRNDHMAYNLDVQAKRFGMSKQDAVKEYIKKHKLYTKRRTNTGEEYNQPRFDLVPLELVEEYACHDARITYDLFVKHYKPVIDADPGLMAVMGLEMEITPVCYRMERRGIVLDRGYTIQALDYEQGRAEEQRARFKEITGSEYKNSAKHIQGLIDYQLPRTDEGNPSLTDDVLEILLVDGSPKAKDVASAVRSIRESEKRASTYYKSYLDKVQPDNIIHPSMWPGGTRTGRFSYSDPNLQNLHRDKDSTEPYVVRGCFIPRPGNVFLAFDFIQMEYNLAAAYANDERLIANLMAGADYHQAMADLTGLDRTSAKTLNFAILYGAGVVKIAAMLGCSVEDAKRLKLKYFLALPKVENLIDRVIATGQKRGYVVNWMGRKLFADYEHCYALPNHLIQGGCADIVKNAMVRIDRKFSSVPMVLQVHDELVFDVPKNMVSRTLADDIRHEMESAFPGKNGLTLRVDGSISYKSLAKRDFVSIEEGI